MELYQLQYFLEAARQKNFTRAAAKLHLAQAALSEQIRKLESELGTALFQRGRRESVLTAAGETLAQHAEALLRQADAARVAVSEVIGLRGGRLTIGAIPSVSAGLLPSAIARFRQRHPQVELMLAEGTSAEVADWVDAGRVELGMVQSPVTEGVFAERILMTERFVLVVPVGHALAGRREADLKAFAAEPFVFFKGRARMSALAACRSAGFEPRMACESGELETVRALVAAGLGVALLPELAARRARPECTLLRVRKPKVERQLSLISKRGHTASSAAAAFEEVLRKAGR